MNNIFLAKLVSASRYSWQGLCATYKSELAFRMECACCVPLLIVALFLPVTTVETSLLIASLALIVIVELLNSAVESVVNLVSPERHPLAGQAKDMASAAVLCAVLNACVVWGVIVGALFF